MSRHRESPITTICPIVELINDSNRSNGYLPNDDDNDDDNNSSTTAPTSSFDDDDDGDDAIDAMPSSFDHIFVDYNESSSLPSITQSINSNKKNNTADIAILNIDVASNTITTSTNNDRTRRRKPLFERMLFPILQKLKQMQGGRKEE